MKDKEADRQNNKISAEFSARLDRLGPKKKVRAIVLLRSSATEIPASRRISPEERKAAIEAVRRSAEAAMPEIDRILKQYNGERLRDEPDALGSIPIETTAEGIKKIAASEYVKAVIEDQPISPLMRQLV